MPMMKRIPSPTNRYLHAPLSALLAVVGLHCVSGLKLSAQTPPALQAVTDRTTYNAGDAVQLRLIFPAPQKERPKVAYTFAVRYVGDDKPMAKGLSLGAADGNFTDYHALWRTPANARTGRYEIDLSVKNAKSGEASEDFPHICSFVVHRQIVRIVSAALAESYYTSGDRIACTIKIENLGSVPLSGMRLEVSERYWPWIAQQRAKVGSNIKKLQSDIALQPHQSTVVSSSQCGVAVGGNQPAIKQYAAALWDRDRKNVLALSFTPQVFVNPPGVVAPRPYPNQYIYPSLDKVDTTSYRQFHPEPFGAAAIEFDTRHTQFATGAEASIKFSLSNPSDSAWSNVAVRVLILGPSEKEVARQDGGGAFGPGTAQRGVMPQELKFQLPPEMNGHFHAGVQIVDGSGWVLASNILQIAVNPLPKSVLIFCGHEDDDGVQMGFIRALVENQIPVHIVYFTSGDAGGCDRYYQHSCGPTEALNFGPIRMQEARAALGHLGVPPEDILFLGLPDGGSGKIWYDHPKSSDPYLSVQLASDYAPYDGIVRPNLAFARDAVVRATKDLIVKFQPDVIFTVHPPAEGHIDHIVNNFFVVKAMQELEHDGTLPLNMELRVDRIFDAAGHPSTPYQYEPHPFYVSSEAMALAQEAGWFYQSQSGNAAEGNIQTWSQLPLTEGYRKVLDWKEHEGWNEKE
jgi:LmbE family N-acetylglucosaminyl deacetylase